MKPSLCAIALSAGALLLSSNAVLASDLSTASPEGAKAYIVSPMDGDTVKSPVKVVFGLSGMGVAPAGVEIENTGHHHLLVNQDTLPANDAPMGAPPIHFGKGQTEAEIELEPGTHTLQLILGNHLHVPHTPAVVSELITITVSE